MSKKEFLDELRERLYGLPKKDIEERLAFYSEMIDDKMDEGVLEVDAVLQLGDVDDIASQIFSETPLSKIVKEKIRPKKKPENGQWVLIILGAPLWFPLLIAAASIVLAVVITIGAIILAFWACAVAAVISFVVLLIVGVVMLFAQGIQTALYLLGIALFAAGIGIILALLSKKLTSATVQSIKTTTTNIKNRLINKENANEENE